MAWKNIEARRAYARAYYARHLEQERARRRESKKKHPESGRAYKLKKILWVKEYKADHPCVVCGESRPECLDFHHPDPNEKELYSMAYAVNSVHINRLMKEVSKCEVLCANCHRVFHAEEQRQMEALNG